MHPGERHLAGADKIEIIFLKPIYLIFGGGKDPRSFHRFASYEDRRQYRRVTVLYKRLEGKLLHAEPEPHEITSEEGETGTRDFRSGGHVYQGKSLPKIEMISGLKIVGRDFAPLP